MTFSYPGVSSSFLTTGTNSGSEFDWALCLGFCSLFGGELKGDRIAGGWRSRSEGGSGLFLGLGGLCSGVGWGICGAVFVGGLGRISGLGRCGGGIWGRLGAVAAAMGVVAFSGENKDGGRVLCGGISGWGG